MFDDGFRVDFGVAQANAAATSRAQHLRSDGDSGLAGQGGLAAHKADGQWQKAHGDIRFRQFRCAARVGHGLDGD